MDSEYLIRERFSALANNVDDSDWAEVQQAARRIHYSRLLLLAAAALVVAAIAAPALGLPGKVVHLFKSSEPAPARVEESFATLDVGAPKGLATGVIAGRTRKVLDQPIGDERRAVLWIAPTKAGGFCMSLGLGRVNSAPHELSGGCDRDRSLPFSLELAAPGPISPTGKILRGPVLYDGSVLIEEARVVRFDFEDGKQTTVPLVWVSEPIDAGFFLYSVPPEHWVEGHHLRVASVEDENGKTLARESLPWFSGFPPRTDR